MFTFLYGIALVLSLFMIVRMARNNYLTIDTYLWSTIILTPIIILGYWLQTRVETPEGVMVAMCLIYLDSTIYLMIILFSMLKALRINVKPVFKVIAYVFAFGHLGLVWACFNNQLYFNSVSFVETQYGRAVIFKSGPLKWIHYVYLLSIILLVVGIFVYNLLRKDSYSKKSLNIYMIFLISGLILYLLELILGSKHSFLPFLYLIGNGIIISNYDFLHSHNLSYLIFSQQKVVGAPGYISFDLKGRLLGYNERSIELIPSLKKEKFDCELSDTSNILKENLMKMIDNWAKGECASQKVTYGESILEFDLTTFKVKANGQNAGYILNIWDITETEKNLELIKEQNESLKQTNEVISGISSLYYILYEMDFVNDTFRKIRAPEYISDFLKKSESARENLHSIAAVMYVDEDIPKAANFFNTEKWEERLKEKDVVSIDCRGKYVGWTRINLIVSSRTETGGINKILVAIENVDAEKEREYQYNEIIDCLSKQYPKMWLINVEDESMICIRNNDMALSLDETTTKDNYNSAIQRYIDKYVDSSDKEHLWYCASYENLVKNIPDNDVYSLNYLANANGVSKYYSMVFAKATGGNIVLAFKDIDEIYRNELVRELELQKALKKAEEANQLMETYNQKLNDEVRAKTANIMDIQRKVVLGVANMIENRDNNTGGHVKRTSDVIKILVHQYRELYGNNLTLENMDDIILTAPMHDLGKIVIDNSILCKPAKLSDEEYTIMKTHSSKSGEIVLSILDGVVESHMVEIAYNLARYHHERWDGTGYPEGLKGEEIPLEARIMAVADVYDALVSKRVYKEPFGFTKAARIMEENMGTQFDPSMKVVFEASRTALEHYYSINS